jgi:hypothetical protein
MLTNEQRANLDAFVNDYEELKNKFREETDKRTKLIIHLYNEGMSKAELSRLFRMPHQNIHSLIVRHSP